MATDVLGIGCCAVDDVLYVQRYPAADSKMEVARHERRCGGLTAVALMTAARMGARCQYAGVLGVDDLSHFAVSAMSEFGVDTSTVVVDEQTRPVHSIIIVDETTKTRTIFYDTQNVQGAHDTLPTKEQIHSSRVLFVDQYGVPGAIRASRIAREGGVAIVADLEDDKSPRFSELLALVDHLILSRDFAAKITGKADPAAAVEKLWREDRSAVVVTAGADGCWYTDRAGTPRHLPAFKVNVVDTTGCGDVFHGAYAAALARDLPLAERVREASAAAAMKAAKVGPAGIPTKDELTRFLTDSSSV